MSELPNPEYNPSGVADCIDTNKMPWLPVQHVPGMSIKPARASSESGIFSLIFKLEAGSSLLCFCLFRKYGHAYTFRESRIYSRRFNHSVLNPGTWGFVSANSKVNSFQAIEDTEVRKFSQ